MKEADELFKTFWDAYGLKRDREAAWRAWKRLSMKDRRAAISGIAAYRADCQKRGISMMYGQGYLSHRRWEDEYEDDGPCAAPPVTGDALDDMEVW